MAQNYVETLDGPSNMEPSKRKSKKIRVFNEGKVFDTLRALLIK